MKLKFVKTHADPQAAQWQASTGATWNTGCQYSIEKGAPFNGAYVWYMAFADGTCLGSFKSWQAAKAACEKNAGR